MQARMNAVMSSWQGFGCSSVSEADVIDSFKVLNCFIVASHHEFRSSLGLTVDSEAMFTYWNHFMGPLGSLVCRG